RPRLFHARHHRLGAQQRPQARRRIQRVTLPPTPSSHMPYRFSSTRALDLRVCGFGGLPAPRLSRLSVWLLLSDHPEVSKKSAATSPKASSKPIPLPLPACSPATKTGNRRRAPPSARSFRTSPTP